MGPMPGAALVEGAGVHDIQVRQRNEPQQCVETEHSSQISARAKRLFVGSRIRVTLIRMTLTAARSNWQLTWRARSKGPTSRRYGVALKTATPLPARFGLKIKLWLALAVKAATEWPQQPGCRTTWIALPGLLLTTPNCPPALWLTYQALEPGSNQI